MIVSCRNSAPREVPKVLRSEMLVGWTLSRPMLLGGCVLFACGCVSWWSAAVNVPPSMMFEQSRTHHHALEKIWVSVASMASYFESLAGISKLAIVGEEPSPLRRSLSSVPANRGGTSGFSCCSARWTTETVSAQTESHEKRVYDGAERESGTKTLRTFTMRRRRLFCKVSAETECERCKSVKQHVKIGMRHVGPRCCLFHRHGDQVLRKAVLVFLYTTPSDADLE